jgi:hypothetical protein
MMLITTTTENDARVRNAGLAHALATSMDLCAKREGFEFNPGVVDAVNKYGGVQFKGLDSMLVSILAHKAASLGDSILKVDVPNEITRCLACAFMIVKLVDAGRLDGHSTLAAAALGMVLESEDWKDPVWAGAKNPRKVAEKMLDYFDAGSLIIRH